MKKRFVSAALAAVMALSMTACGSSNSAIELSIEELERYANAHIWVDVCKGWQAE